MEVKFEEQFKHRDESNVNALCAGIGTDSKKALIRRGFAWFHTIRFTVTLGKPVTIATAGIGPRPAESHSGQCRENRVRTQRCCDDSNAMMGEQQHRG
jgi:hypothetical protein